MARFPDHILEEIRTRLNLVDLISEYVQLKKTGNGFQGLCPFHSEKSPSFHVHSEKQIFHCFGCHKGGNAFTFLMAVEGLNFPETVKKLADKTGVELPKNPAALPAPTRPPSVVEEENRLLSANEWAAKYFNYLLVEGKDRKPYEYLKGRGISDKTIERFNIGVAPSGWNTLIQLLMKRGYTFNEIAKAGLAVVKDDSPNGGYDRFRSRLMFPIANRDGQVVGFGARLLEDDPKQPKYLNSAESSLFSKRNILYGLHENQRGIRLKNEAVIVEGYMDVVGLSEAGVQNAVATMGTAFTEEHCLLLRGLTRKVVTVFDPDKAGTEASRRSVHIFLNAGIFAKDLILPEGKDPDEYVLAHGAESFFELCERAPRQVTKLLKEVAAEGPLSEEQRTQWLERLTPVLVASRRLPDRALLWDNLSLVLQLSLETLQAVAEGAGARQQALKPSVALRNPNAPNPASRARSQNSGQPSGPERTGPDAGEHVEDPWQPPGENRWKGGQKKWGGGQWQNGQGGNWGNKFGSNSGGPSRQQIRTPIRKRPAENAMEVEFFLSGASCPEGLKAIPAEFWRTAFSDSKLVGYLDILVKTDGSEAFSQALAGLLGQETDTEILDKASSLVFSKDSMPPVKPADLVSIAERILDQRKNQQIHSLSMQVKLAQRIGNEAEQLSLLERLNALRGWQPSLDSMQWLFAQLNPQLAKPDTEL
jgi:DNA primase